ERQSAPEESTAKEAMARLGSQPPGSVPRSPMPPHMRPLPPGGMAKSVSKPQPLAPPMTDDEGNIDLDSEPPLLPTSHVSVPHAQGSRQQRTWSSAHLPKTAPPVAAHTPDTSVTKDLPADVIDLAAGHRKDE